MILNVFYGEPDPDRWLPFDRFPRRIVRRIVRGPPAVRGHRRVFLNLVAGLQRLGVGVRVNDYRHARNNPRELACIVGKPCVLDRQPWRNPILFGAAVHAHPIDDPALLERLPVRRVLVPGEWMRKMASAYYGDRVAAWPVGVDTDYWSPARIGTTRRHVLVYDKVHWNRPSADRELVQPVVDAIERRGLPVLRIRYGAYDPAEYREALWQSHAMVFLTEHETQGLAYQEALAVGVPVLAWDRGGEWRDPSYYPHRVRFAPVTSVPYWDRRCGVRFTDRHDFDAALDSLMAGIAEGAFSPREYVEEHLELAEAARAYLQHVAAVQEA